MDETLTDRVLGTLTYDEDTETFSGTVEFRPGQAVALSLMAHTTYSSTSRAFKAFLTGARRQWQRLQKDDEVSRRHAVGLFQKAAKKAARAVPEVETLLQQLALVAVEMDNSGITILHYANDRLWPRKRFPVPMDSSGNIV